MRLAVDAGGLPVDVRAGRPDRDPGLHRRGNHIGEVILFLRVVILERGQPGLEPRRGQHHDAGVDLANFQLLVGGVLVLDDARHLAAAPDDAAVAIGVIKLHGEQPDALAGRPDQPLQGHRPDQRHIAIEHQRRRRVIEQRHRLHHRGEVGDGHVDECRDEGDGGEEIAGGAHQHVLLADLRQVSEQTLAGADGGEDGHRHDAAQRNQLAHRQMRADDLDDRVVADEGPHGADHEEAGAECRVLRQVSHG